MQFGDYRVEIIPDCEFHLDGGAMFGVVPRTLWAKVCPPDEQNRIRMNMNCVFIETGNERILIETGIGDKWSEKHTEMFGIKRQRPLAESLREVARVEPDNITKRFSERSLAFNAEHLSVFLGPFIADASFDQDPFVASLDEHTIHVHSYAVLLIRRTNLCPQCPRNHSKHGAPIEMKLTVGNNFYAVVAKLHSISFQSSPYFRRFLGSLFFDSVFGLGLFCTGSTGAG